MAGGGGTGGRASSADSAGARGGAFLPLHHRPPRISQAQGASASAHGQAHGQQSHSGGIKTPRGGRSGATWTAALALCAVLLVGATWVATTRNSSGGFHAAFEAREHIPRITFWRLGSDESNKTSSEASSSSSAAAATATADIASATAAAASDAIELHEERVAAVVGKAKTQEALALLRGGGAGGGGGGALIGPIDGSEDAPCPSGVAPQPQGSSATAIVVTAGAGSAARLQATMADLLARLGEEGEGEEGGEEAGLRGHFQLHVGVVSWVVLSSPAAAAAARLARRSTGGRESGEARGVTTQSFILPTTTTSAHVPAHSHTSSRLSFSTHRTEPTPL